MKNILKITPLYLLVISAYVWLAAAFIDDSESMTFFNTANWVFVGVMAVNFVYSVMFAIFNKNSGRGDLIAVLAAKALFAPLCVCLFVCGIVILFSLVLIPLYAPLLIIATPFLILICYALVLSSAVYAVGDMVKIYKSAKSPVLLLATVVCCVCQFIFVADVVSLFIYVLVLKKKLPEGSRVVDI